MRTTSSSTETERGDNSFDPLSILESIREEQRRSADAVKEMEAAVAAQVPKLKDEIRQREQEVPVSSSISPPPSHLILV